MCHFERVGSVEGAPVKLSICMIKRVVLLYFSPTGTTRRICESIANGVINGAMERVVLDITPAASRREMLQFGEGDLVIFGAPVYIGRMPNLISPYFRSIRGGGAFGVAVAVYGNRAFDDGLIELRDILHNDGFKVLAAAAFVGEHSFSKVLGGGRPDDCDVAKGVAFGRELAQYCNGGKMDNDFPFDEERLPQVPGNPFPYKGFYKAKDNKDKSVDIRRVTPKTDASKCTRCALCADICSMGCIVPVRDSSGNMDFSNIEGICIKCSACVKRCPAGAKYFDDDSFLSHLQVLEETFSGRRCEPQWWWQHQK